jgi:hypothetical protein
MTNRSIFACTASLLLALTAVIATAETKRSAQADSGLTVPFNSEEQSAQVTKVHNLQTILSSLKRQKFEKDQFETSTAYAERMANTTLIENVAIDSLMAFQFAPLDAFPLCRTEYKADTSEIGIRCDLAGRHFFYLPQEGNRILKSFTVGVAKSTDKSSYVASNAFGVKKSVTIRHAVGTGLAISNLGDITVGEHENVLRNLVLTVQNVPVDEARRNLNDLGLLFVVKLVPPYLLKESKAQGPTVSRPVDFTGEYEYLYSTLEELWVINLKSGAVLRRFNSRGKPLN